MAPRNYELRMKKACQNRGWRMADGGWRRGIASYEFQISSSRFRLALGFEDTTVPGGTPATAPETGALPSSNFEFRVPNFEFQILNRWGADAAAPLYLHSGVLSAYLVRAGGRLHPARAFPRRPPREGGVT
jgi:hypothetical protein